MTLCFNTCGMYSQCTTFSIHVVCIVNVPHTALLDFVRNRQRQTVFLVCQQYSQSHMSVMFHLLDVGLPVHVSNILGQQYSRWCT